MADDPQPGQEDLFLPPPEDAARPVGTVEGPPGWHEGFGAGLRVWCGPQAGWRDMGELVGILAGVTTIAGHVQFHRGRLRASLTFDLGPHSIPRPRAVVAAECEAEGD